tara:strand:+ start:379 stop:1212 length:834 start_codon:yes stop_codon:yes gene_type:complete
MVNRQIKKREPQLNPATRLVDKVATMKLPERYESTILHDYLTYSQGIMLERMGGLLRMLSKDVKLTESVREWQKLNLAICTKQLADMTGRREVLTTGMEIDLPEISIPDSYYVEFIASHPVVHGMIKTIKAVSNELRESEALYMGGIIDDADYENLKAQTVTVLSGVVDRIAKATFPGKREGGGYSPAQLAKYIREGNRLEFADVPASVRDIIADYESAGDKSSEAVVASPKDNASELDVKRDITDEKVKSVPAAKKATKKTTKTVKSSETTTEAVA